LGLLWATGDAVPFALWSAELYNSTATTAPAPNLALALGLDSATVNKRTGEIVLEGNALLGDGNLTAIGAADLARLVNALTAAGLADPARALALDAALSNGT